MTTNSISSKMPDLNTIIVGLICIALVYGIVVFSLSIKDGIDSEARQAALLEDGYGYVTDFPLYPTEQAIKTHCLPDNAVIVDDSHRLMESASVGGPFLLYCK